MIGQNRLTRAIVRTPGFSFAKGLTTAGLGVPDLGKTMAQHAAYCEALQQCGLSLTRLEADEQFPDSTFVEDTAVIIGAVDELEASRIAVLTRPGAASRTREVEGIAPVLAQFFADLPSIKEPGTLDGGDVCEARNHFFIGISERTNEAGAQQLRKVLTANGYTSSFVDIRAVKDILHLKSGLAYLGDNRLVVIDALASLETFRDYELVRVNERDQYAANCLRVNDLVLLAAGFPEFEEKLGELGYETIALEMAEFQKMDGGLSCLSLRF